MNKKKLIVLMTLMTLKPLSAGPFWDKLMRAGRLKPANHAMCYYDSKGDLRGENVHKKSYLASITKLLTTYVATHQLGAAFKHSTKLFYNEKTQELHIQGGMDPIYSKEKLFYLVNQFNNNGITKIKKITFDKKFSAWSQADSPSLAQRRPSRVSSKKTAGTLKAYLHTPGWNANLKAYRGLIKSNSREWLDYLQIERDPKKLKLSIGSVIPAEKASFDIKGSHVKSFIVLSSKIEGYMKHYNIYSHNFLSDEYFEVAGGKKEVDKILSEFMNEHMPNYNAKRVGFKKGEPTIQLYNGSGYPLENPRRDNYATCAVVIKMIKQLDIELQQNDHEIQKLIAVTGTDNGTIRKRLRGAQFKNKSVVKTGTTNPVSALAGMMSTQTGRRYFAIFNHRWGGLSSSPLRNLQNKVARKLMSDFGGGSAFKYRPKKIHTVDDVIIKK